ncbi:hypothetical protein QBC32DRAFT_337073 [Pseudoneurospora amorphoporcata]|uniref:Uncharacterized protein n=1 Tax=Pseudoneurospora amorphoporcata TaxID=241081 RepID=A0AAN6P242_9PEZI|nr:hypothetical protein QBC32DRAFT_337073 [Pseudoneurospora amorphoporcata]
MFRRGDRTWTRPSSKPFPFVLVRCVSHISGFGLAAKPLPTVASGGRVQFVWSQWCLSCCKSGIPDTALGSLSAAPARPHHQTIRFAWAWQAGWLCLPLCPSSATVYLDGCLSFYIPTALVCFATGMLIGPGRFRH